MYCFYRFDLNGLVEAGQKNVSFGDDFKVNIKYKNVSQAKPWIYLSNLRSELGKLLSTNEVIKPLGLTDQVLRERTEFDSIEDFNAFQSNAIRSLIASAAKDYYFHHALIEYVSEREEQKRITPRILIDWKNNAVEGRIEAPGKQANDHFKIENQIMEEFGTLMVYVLTKKFGLKRDVNSNTIQDAKHHNSSKESKIYRSAKEKVEASCYWLIHKAIDGPKRKTLDSLLPKKVDLERKAISSPYAQLISIWSKV